MIVSLMGLASTVAAQASTSYTFTDTGHASAVLTFGNGTITITLTDLYVNPNDVSDNLSGFSFKTNVTPTTDSISSSSAASVDVASNGTYTNTGTIAPGWGLTLTGAVTKLDDLGYAGPSNTIVGAPNSGNVYSNGCCSIDGNGAHNPFLYETATWTLAEAGVAPSTTVSDVSFMFGTTEGAKVEPGTLTSTTTTPEPATEAMVLGGLALIFAGRKYRQRSR